MALNEPNPPAHPDRASWLTIDAGALAHNLAVVRDMVGRGTRLGAVIKGNAYGHGLRDVLPVLHPLVDVLHVITVQEACAIRDFEAASDQPAKPVLVIGPVSPREAVVCAARGVELVVGDAGFGEVAQAILGARGPALRVHVHIDTGLSREGFLPDRLEAGLAFLSQVGSAIEVVGVLTHFADTEDVTEQSWAHQQLRAFDAGCEVLRGLLTGLGRPTDLVRHTAASAAALVLPESRMDVARVGISAYGLWPSRETRISVKALHGSLPVLRPALSWRCGSQLVKDVPAGSFVGYGCTHRCADDTRVAVLPVGYFDGYPRLLSNRAHVLVGGRRCPVLGRVMMNHIIVDVTGVAGRPDHVEAVLLGPSGDERITADDLAGWSQTINYEIVTRLGSHLRRVVVDGDGA